jgi:hypothetical protein
MKKAIAVLILSAGCTPLEDSADSSPEPPALAPEGDSEGVLDGTTPTIYLEDYTA